MTFKLQEVFGISVKPIQSYIERADVDGRFLMAVESDHHIVVYGASKQGKTALRQKHISDDQCEIYRCNPKSTPDQIYQHVLHAANVRIEKGETRSEGLKGGAKGAWSITASLPWVGGTKATGEVHSEANTQKTFSTEFVDLNLGDSQSVASILQTAKFTKFVVLENFHYLPKNVQKELSFDLKTFHEMGIRFIVLGVWRESNQLLVLNPDLQDRMAEIPVEPWTVADFDQVIVKGEQKLNITIPELARSEFKKQSYGNVGMVQEFLKIYCSLNGVNETSPQHRVLDSTNTISETLKTKATDQRGRLLTVLEGIAAKSRTDRRKGGSDPLTLPYYLVQVLLTASVSELTDGITRKHLHEKIRELHRRQQKDTIRINDVAHLLKRLPSLQDESASPFLYYDTNQQRLRIVDAGLLFALAQVDRQSIRDEILDPLETYDDSDLDDDVTSEDDTDDDEDDEFID